MRRRVAAAGFAAGVLFPLALAAAGPANAQSPQPDRSRAPAASIAAPEGEVRTYRHPLRKFTLAVPPGAEVAERDEPSQVSLRAREGYIINLQSGDANPAITLPQMTAKLEARYYGPGRPWSQKLSQQPTTVAGLDAVEAEYEGAGTRVRVVIARGMKSDFVFMYFAPIDAFEKMAGKFNWVLANFRPGPADQPPAVRPGAFAAPASPAASPAASPDSGPAAGPAAAPKRFTQAGFGYTIQYPGDWELATPTATTATFSGRSGTDAFQAVVSIQNVRPPGAETPDQAARAALAGLKSSLSREASDLSIVGERPLTYKNGRLSLSGVQMVVTYSYAGQRYRKWALVLPRPAGAIAHIWSFTAPEPQFHTYRPLADAMLKSWTIRPGRNG